MKKETYYVTAGALLHDIGKIIFRTGGIDSGAHGLSGKDFIGEFTSQRDILEAIHYHHKQDIQDAGLSDNSLAYLVYIADNISSGLDRRKIEGETKSAEEFNQDQALSSVFNILNNNNGQQGYIPYILAGSDSIIYPQELEKTLNSEQYYNRIYQGLKQSLKTIVFEPEHINSLLELCEAYFSYLPSSTLQDDIADISLFDHLKTTAAIAACTYVYLTAQGRENFREELFTKEKDFYLENAYLMFSCDISGIQSFIYTISSKGALKGLRARSFYLEILLEHIVDELLALLGLTRANLIYTGGGHAYILLPNTPETIKQIEEAKRNINHWLIENFGNALYLAIACQECSANDLMNKSEDKEAYQNIFRQLSGKLSLAKMHRYNAQEIRMLNNPKNNKPEGRECSICGSVDNLVQDNEYQNVCENCAALQEISRMIIKKDTIFITSQSRTPNRVAVRLPSLNGGDSFLYAVNETEARQMLTERREIKMAYSKNRLTTGLPLSSKIWMGEYTSVGKQGIATFEELAEKSIGIERLAVLRADVDNLGRAFVSGFVREDGEKNRYVTLTRTATLSRQLSLFFKYFINNLPSRQMGQEFSLTGKKEAAPMNVTIVYSGGDDLFIVGAWNEVIELAVDLKNAFQKFSGGTLSISAGIGIYDPSYPLARMALETEELEKAAKNNPAKNSISLFGEEVIRNQVCARHTYSWEIFEKQVIGEKLRLLQAFIKKEKQAGEEGAFGSSYLYNLMQLIRETEDNGARINIARFAYLLGRMAPAKKNEQQYKEYKSFADKMYAWILSTEDRRQLLTAMTIFIYLQRQKEES